MGGGEVNQENRAERERGDEEDTACGVGVRGGGGRQAAERTGMGGRAKRVSGAAGHLVCLCTHTPPPALLAAARVHCCSLPSPPVASRDDKHIYIWHNDQSSCVFSVASRRLLDSGRTAEIYRRRDAASHAVAHISH